MAREESLAEATTTTGPAGDALASIPEIFQSVAGLVAAGGNGLAAIIFVAVMVVLVFSLMFGAKLSPDFVGLIRLYLAFGVVCIALSLSMGVLDQFLIKTYDMHVIISPSLATEGYPDPVLRVGGDEVEPDSHFPVNRNVEIFVGLDETIKRVKEQKQIVAAAQQAEQAAQEKVVKLEDTVAAQAMQVQAIQADFETLKTLPLPSWASSKVVSISGKLKSFPTSASDGPFSNQKFLLDNAIVTPNFAE